MNILVTGANGQLGNEMRTVSRETDDRYIFSDIVPADGEETIILDITDPARVAAAVKEPGHPPVIFCAGQDQDQGDFRAQDTVLDRLPEALPSQSGRIPSVNRT